MIFSKKKVTVTYTVEECKNCKMQRKRKFAKGDILFSESLKCTSCDAMTRIEKIFAECIEK